MQPKISVVIRLGQLDLLEILLCFLITHTDVATQRQESPVGKTRTRSSTTTVGVRGGTLCPWTHLSNRNLYRNSTTNSLESLARHLQVVVPLWFRETLEVHQTRMKFLIVISELWRKTTVDYSQRKKRQLISS